MAAPRRAALALTLGLVALGPASPAAAAPTEVHTGVYAYALSGLDFQAGTFRFDGYLWFRWRCAELDAGGLDFALINGEVDDLDDAPVTEADGRCRQSRRLRATMRADFRLRDYPFDAQVLPIVVEHRRYGADRLVFVADDGAIPPGKSAREAFLARDLDVHQWQVLEVRHGVADHAYETDFGSIERGAWDGASSRYRFEVTIARPFFPYLLKVVLPLLIIVGMAFLSFAIRPQRFDSKVSLLVTALLSTVALHLTQSSALPEVGYLVRADIFFLISYAALGASLVLVTLEHRRSEADEIDGPSRALPWARAAVIGGFVLAIVVVAAM
ncbi:MAG: hypothetical protein R3B09_04180 [Nannocystaceae bacterium]